MRLKKTINVMKQVVKILPIVCWYLWGKWNYMGEKNGEKNQE